MKEFELLSDETSKSSIKKLVSFTEETEKKSEEPNSELRSYQVVMINQSDYTIIAVSLNYVNWAPTPLIGKTCGYPCDDRRCFDEKRWAAICTVECGQNHNLWIKVRDTQGRVYTQNQGDPYTFYANCGAAGGVLAFCN